VVAPLALTCFWRRRHERPVKILALSALLYALVLAVFFVSSRYRLLLALLLLPFAVDQAFHLARGGRDRRLLAALALLLNLPNAFTRSFAASPAERGLLQAHALRNQGLTVRADALSAELVERFPTDSNLQMFRAEQLFDGGACTRAEAHLRRAIALSPRAAAPRLLLADCLERLRRPAAAELAYAGALAVHPFHPVALKRASALYLSQNRPREAKPLLTRFVAAGYRDPQVSGWLSRIASAQP
jgi:Flp pilus assembly protein TadD